MLMAEILQARSINPGAAPESELGDGGAHHGDGVQHSLRAVVAVAEVNAAQHRVAPQNWLEDVVSQPVTATKVKMAQLS